MSEAASMHKFVEQQRLRPSTGASSSASNGASRSKDNFTEQKEADQPQPTTSAGAQFLSVPSGPDGGRIRRSGDGGGLGTSVRSSSSSLELSSASASLARLDYLDETPRSDSP